MQINKPFIDRQQVLTDGLELCNKKMRDPMAVVELGVENCLAWLDGGSIPSASSDRDRRSR